MARPKRRWWIGSRIDRFPGALEKVAASPKYEFDGSGWIFATLLPYLDSCGVDLMRSDYDAFSTALTKARGGTLFCVLTSRHKKLFANQLETSRHSKSSLHKYYCEFNERDEPAAGEAMLTGLKALKEAIDRVDAKTVVILEVG
jgi:hypothetical protein